MERWSTRVFAGGSPKAIEFFVQITLALGAWYLAAQHNYA
jgi:hypothetical protein